MTVSVRLAAFVAILALALGAGYALGSWAGPIDTGSTDHEMHGPDGGHGS